MSIDDVEDVGNMLIVKIPTSKTNKPRCFIIATETRDMKNMVEIYRKYVSLRSPATAHNRLFVSYNNGKCSVQPIGINTFGKIPSQIASYLKLLNPHEYTGHSFRRSSTTILADAGADVLELKRHGGWKSSTVAESYVEESVQHKVAISNQILGRGPAETVAASYVEESVQHEVAISNQILGRGAAEEANSSNATTDILPSTSRSHEIPQILIKNCTNCKVNVHIYRNE